MTVALLHFLSPWDLVLLIVVTIMGTLLAYVPDPRWKAFLLALPFPFTVANLSLGRPVGPSHVLGLSVLFIFLNLVRWLYAKARVPIILSIAVSLAAYLALALLLNRFVPATPVAFWCILGPTLLAGGLLLAFLPSREEPAHRSELPLGIKMAAIAGVVALIVILKQALGGFMTMFPMVTTIAAYEARHSLWTSTRQIPVLMITTGPMMAVMWLAQNLLDASVPQSLLVGWVVYLAIMVPVTFAQFRRSERHQLATPRGVL